MACSRGWRICREQRTVKVGIDLDIAGRLWARWIVVEPWVASVTTEAPLPVAGAVGVGEPEGDFDGVGGIVGVDLLGLIDGDGERAGVAGVSRRPRQINGERGVAGAAAPLVEEALQRLAGGLLEHDAKIVGLNLAELVLVQIVGERGEENLVAETLAEHVEDAAALGVAVVRAREFGVWVRVEVADHAGPKARCVQAPGGEALALEVAEDGGLIAVRAADFLRPERFAERGESFVQPDVLPGLAGD